MTPSLLSFAKSLANFCHKFHQGVWIKFIPSPLSLSAFTEDKVSCFLTSSRLNRRNKFVNSFFFFELWKNFIRRSIGQCTNIIFLKKYCKHYRVVNILLEDLCGWTLIEILNFFRRSKHVPTKMCCLNSQKALAKYTWEKKISIVKVMVSLTMNWCFETDRRFDVNCVLVLLFYEFQWK